MDSIHNYSMIEEHPISRDFEYGESIKNPLLPGYKRVSDIDTAIREVSGFTLADADKEELFFPLTVLEGGVPVIPP